MGVSVAAVTAVSGCRREICPAADHARAAPGGHRLRCYRVAASSPPLDHRDLRRRLYLLRLLLDFALSPSTPPPVAASPPTPNLRMPSDPDTVSVMVVVRSKSIYSE
eukprot:GHVU01157678.1.p2 GENE.GHVU01157678.1~~GHVU01157678.1.p2  ORF type:complete len:107 (+),score=5.76 GHVU01157678.1:243-563(+)